MTQTLRAFKDFVEANPYTGTAEQVVTLSLGLAEAAEQLDSNTYIHYRKETGINEKILSKLKVIGRTLLKILRYEALM